jgi:hypothetical protein
MKLFFLIAKKCTSPHFENAQNAQKKVRQNPKKAKKNLLI